MYQFCIQKDTKIKNKLLNLQDVYKCALYIYIFVCAFNRNICLVCKNKKPKCT